MLASMFLLPLFSAPAAVAVSVHSSLSPDAVVDRLAQAVDERRYSNPSRFSVGYFRLGGSIAQARVILMARPYLIPGLVAGRGAMTIELRAEVIEAEDGSDLRGTVTAPIRWPTPVFLVTGSVLWAAVGIAGNGSNWLTWGFVVAGIATMATLWSWILRHNQRRALRNVDELVRTIDSILSDAAPQLVTLRNA